MAENEFYPNGFPLPRIFMTFWVIVVLSLVILRRANGANSFSALVLVQGGPDRFRNLGRRLRANHGNGRYSCPFLNEPWVQGLHPSHSKLRLEMTPADMTA